MTELITLLGNPRAGSRTATFAAAFAAALRTELSEHGVTVGAGRTIDLAGAVAVTFDGPVTPTAPVPDAVEAVSAARLLVVATPSYKGTYTGLLKVFLDRFGATSLAGVTAVPIGIAASPGHVTATAADLSRLLGELGADVPGVVGVNEAEFTDIDAAAATYAAAIAEQVAKALAG